MRIREIEPGREEQGSGRSRAEHVEREKMELDSIFEADKERSLYKIATLFRGIQMKK